MPTAQRMLESFGRNFSWMMWFFGMPIDPRRSMGAASHDRVAMSAAEPVTQAPVASSRRRGSLPGGATV